MAKFGLLYRMLLEQEVAAPRQVYCPEEPTIDWLNLVHDVSYIQGYCQGTLPQKAQRRIGLPWSPELVRRTKLAVGGTILTAKLALKHGLACNTVGGTHHAYADFGSGFCIFNDLAIAARVVQQLNLAQHILIVDLDVHQGDGTAHIFQGDSSVFTFSMHCEVNFPSRKQRSDCDVPLPEGLEDDAYLQILAAHLPGLIAQVNPDLIIYDAGVDSHIGDRLGKLALTDAGIFRRDMQVLSTCAAAGHPVACVIGGGYSNDFDALAYRHSLLHRAASEVFRQYRL